MVVGLVIFKGFVPPGDFRSNRYYKERLAEGDDPSMILREAWNRPEIAALALEKGANVNRGQVIDAMSTHLKYYGRGIKKAKWFIERGADVDFVGYGSKSTLQPTTALLKATENCDLHAVEFLIENGADVNLSVSQRSPVLYAALCKEIDVVKKLIANGADINVKGFWHQRQKSIGVM